MALTASDMSAVIQNRYQAAVEALNQETFYFWPGMPAHGFCQVDNRVGADGGDSEFGLYGELVSHPKDDGVDHTVEQDFKAAVTGVAASESEVLVTLSDPAARKMTAPNAYQAWVDKKLRATLRGHYKAFDAMVFKLAASMQVGHTDTGAALEYADLIGVAEILAENNVPGPYWGALSVKQWDDLLTQASTPILDASKSGDRIGGDIWVNYKIREFLGINWLITPSVYGDGTDDYGFVMSTNQDASPIGLVFEKMPLPMELERDASAQVTEHVSVMSVGAGIVDQHTGASDATGFYIKTRT